jgi:spectinomycin phosphotransferase
VRALPDDLEFDALVELLRNRWEIDVASAGYAPVGGGSYHWVVVDGTGARHFVTVDDLDNKGWLGGTRSAAFDGLLAAFDTATALREQGLEFVVAPVRTTEGSSLVRVDRRYTLSVFPFVDREAGRFGEYTASERAALIPLLAALHEAPVAAPRLDLALPLRGALAETDRQWESGPLAEQARELLAERAAAIDELLARYDRLAAGIAPDDWVVTHGEPHAGNLIDSQLLVDWDTVALAPSERDLWMPVADDPEAGSRYTEATGRELDPATLEFFRLRWDLADLTSFADKLRSPHTDNADTRKAYEALTIILGRAR